MKKLLIVGLVSVLAGLGWMSSVCADEATDQVVSEVKADLTAAGVESAEVKDSVSAINDMVKSGVPAEEAGNVVSQAAKQARAEGLKGKDLAARVKAAAKGRKAEHKAAKEAKKATRDAEKETRKAEKEVKKTERKAAKEAGKAVRTEEREMKREAVKTRAESWKGKGKK